MYPAGLNFPCPFAFTYFISELAAQCIVIGPVCGFVTSGERASGVRTLLQPARAQCLRLSERFFHLERVFNMQG